MLSYLAFACCCLLSLLSNHFLPLALCYNPVIFLNLNGRQLNVFFELRSDASPLLCLLSTLARCSMLPPPPPSSCHCTCQFPCSSRAWFLGCLAPFGACRCAVLQKDTFSWLYPSLLLVSGREAASKSPYHPLRAVLVRTAQQRRTAWHA
jgi:hypothetical protein